MKIFISYATLDLSNKKPELLLPGNDQIKDKSQANDREIYRIDDVVNYLEMQKQIEKVYYWRHNCLPGSQNRNFMIQSIKDSDILLLFCSTNAQKSAPVQQEIGMALYGDKRIIPICRSQKSDIADEYLLGFKYVQYNELEFEKFFEELFLALTNEKPVGIEAYSKIDNFKQKVIDANNLETINPSKCFDMIRYCEELYPTLALDFADKITYSWFLQSKRKDLQKMLTNLNIPIKISKDIKPIFEQSQSPTGIRMSLAFLGDSLCGKSSIVNRLINHDFEDTKKTIGVRVETLYLKNIQNIAFTVQLREIGGSQQFFSFIEGLIHGVMCYVIVYDLSRPSTFEEIDKWFNVAQKGSKNPLFLVIGNKSDLSTDIIRQSAIKKINSLKTQFQIHDHLCVSAGFDNELIQIRNSIAAMLTEMDNILYSKKNDASSEKILFDSKPIVKDNKK